MNVEIRTEAEQFLFGEYINRIFFALHHTLSFTVWGRGAAAAQVAGAETREIYMYHIVYNRRQYKNLLVCLAKYMDSTQKYVEECFEHSRSVAKFIVTEWGIQWSPE